MKRIIASIFALLALITISCDPVPTSIIIGSSGNPIYSHCLTIILDDAHGVDVAGKCSPDGRHKEWQWSKTYINLLGQHLTDIGFNVVYSAPEDTEPGLWERVRRMNLVYGPAVVFSLHNNAAGMGDWKEAHGYSVWTTRGVTKSDSCATIMFNNLRIYLPDLSFRQDLADGDPDYEANFIVLLSKHPSFLLEFMFQDNDFDLQLIENPYLCRTLLLIIDVSFLQIEQYLCKSAA